MKTKYILHGGFTKGKTDEDNSKFYAEILKDAPERARVLLVCFAKDEGRVSEATKKVMGEFEKNKWQNKIYFEIASENSFAEQAKSADIVYFHGGVTMKLLDVLKKFLNLKDLLSGKIVAGESAGANVFGKLFYSPNLDKIGEGLGFLPVKIIPHYSEQYKDKFDGVGEEFETLLLPEYQFKVYYSE